MLTTDTQRKLEQFLVTNQLVTEESLNNAKLKSAKDNTSIIEALVALRMIAEEDSIKLVAMISKTPYVDLTNQTISDDILKLVPRDMASTYMAVPFGVVNGLLNVAMIDPTNLQAIDFLAKKTGYNIHAYMASKASISHILSTYRADLGEEVAQALNAPDEEKSIEEQAEEAQKKPKVDAKNIATIVQDAPITRALNTILEYAVNSHASDIHIEPTVKDVRIRYRIDGILQEVMSLPKTIEPALVSRVKILSNLKIDEHRIPQDGQAQFKTAGHEVDLRIAIAPIAHGEQVVIRLLDKSGQLITLENLGLHGRGFALVDASIKKPHGMILSTGPTGSGKSTTLYAVIQKIKNNAINIVTLEDPVEYKMEGINQIQVNSEVGLTFANGLRSILRQDPNVIMVGEIRDQETADLAVQSALTGHLVLSTLHTNSASGVLPRLLDMKIEPFLIASTVNTVIGQRLVRKICDNCRTQVAASEAAIAMINQAVGPILPKTEPEQSERAKQLGYDNLPLASQNAYTLFKGAGCSECVDGYSGRVGIFEVFEMTHNMEKLLTAHATTSDIQKQAVADGMLTMKQDGILKALTGVTTIEEVARVASDF